MLGWAEDRGGELVVRALGQADALAARLIARLTTWQAEGRPTDSGLVIRAYPAGHLPIAQAVVSQRWTTFALDWI